MTYDFNKIVIFVLSDVKLKSGMKRMLKKYWWVIAIILVVAFWSKIKEIPMVKNLCEKLGMGGTSADPATTDLTVGEKTGEDSAII